MPRPRRRAPLTVPETVGSPVGRPVWRIPAPPPTVESAAMTRQHPTGRLAAAAEGRFAMAALIALVAIGLFASGAIAGIVGVVSVAIRREERKFTLTSQAPTT